MPSVYETHASRHMPRDPLDSTPVQMYHPDTRRWISCLDMVSLSCPLCTFCVWHHQRMVTYQVSCCAHASMLGYHLRGFPAAPILTHHANNDQAPIFGQSTQAGFEHVTSDTLIHDVHALRRTSQSDSYALRLDILHVQRPTL